MVDRYIRFNFYTRGTGTAKKEIDSLRVGADDLERKRTLPIDVEDKEGQLKLKDLSTKLDILGKKRVAATADVKDSAGKAKLIDLDLKLRRLNAYVANPKISLNGADRTLARILVIDAAMNRLSGKSARINIEGNRGGLRGLFGRVGSLFSGAGGGGGGAGPATSGAGGLAGVFSNPWAIGGAVAAGLAALPFAAQAAAGAITFALGGALTGIAILGASKSKAVQKSFADLKKSASNDLTQIGKPFRGVMQSIFSTAKTVMGQLTPVFKSAATIIGGPFKTFATTFLKAFTQPAVVTSIKAVATAFGNILKALTPQLPGDIKGIATGITRIANVIKNNPKAFADFISFLLKGAGFALSMIAALTSAATWIEGTFIPKMKTFFTKTIPTIFDIMKQRLKLNWLRVEIDALSAVSVIIGAFAKIPGPTQAAFKRAKAGIDTELNKMKVSVAQATATMQGDFDKLHNKHVVLDIFGKGKWAAHTRTEVGAGGLPIAAAGMMVRGGTPGRDSVLIKAMPGELVVPTAMVRAGAVDHLRGKIKGFGGGGIIPSYSGRVPGLGPWMSHNASVTESSIIASIGSAFASVWQRVISSAVGALGGPTSASAAQAQAYARGRLGAYGWGFNQFQSLVNLWNGESGWNRLIRNQSSGAYGIPQALPASKMGAAANPPISSAAAQINWGLGYIKQVYGSPNSAYGSWLSRSPHWYGKGVHGWFNRPTLIGVGERGRERVDITPGGSGGATIHNHFTINAGPMAHPADIGREVVQVIKEYERRSGKSWRS